METAIPPESSVRFEGFELNLRTGELYRNGARLRIRGHPVNVLAVLLERPGELVTRDTLRKRLWPENTYVDFEQILNNSIGKLRDALGDRADSPKFIETLPRLGYRFICPVETAPASELASVPMPSGVIKAEVEKPKASKRRSRKMKWTALFAIGVLLTGTGGFAWYALRLPPKLRIASYTQIASVRQPNEILGTDGSSLYLNLSLPDRNGVVPVSGGRVVPLSFDLPASNDSPNDFSLILSMSPDGSRLVVSSYLDQTLGAKLWIVDRRGGEARYLARGFDADWSPDGTRIVYSTVHGDVYVVPSEGGEPWLLVASPAPSGVPFAVWGFAWSPDGSRIRFARNDRYWEISADGKNPHELLPNWHAANPKYFMGSGRWMPSGDFFFFPAGGADFSQNLAAARQLWALDERRRWLLRSHPEPVQITTGAIVWGGFVVSKDGKTIYATGMTLKGELVRYDARAKKLLPYLGGISAQFVTFSRDGKYLVYVTYPEGMMWRANRDGSGMQQLTGPPFYPLAPKWSPDGTQILFFEHSRTHKGELYTISSQGGLPKCLLPGHKEQDLIPGWSPDGKKIVFNQIPPGAPGYGLFLGVKSRILDLQTGKVIDLPPCPEPCFSPEWSPDGRYIVEVAADHNRLMLLDLRTNRWSELDPKLRAINYPRWSQDSRSIYFQDSDSSGPVRSTDPGIYRVPVSGGKAEKVVDLKNFRGTGWSGLDPDDTPLLTRDVGIYDIYALALEQS